MTSGGNTAWETARPDAKAILAKVARDDDTITYTVFVRRLNRKVRGLDLRPHDDERLDHLLDAIWIEEERDGRGLNSVLVVELAFPGLPSDGFFELAAPRHLPGTKKRVIFETERDRVWAAHPSAWRLMSVQRHAVRAGIT